MRPPNLNIKIQKIIWGLCPQGRMLKNATLRRCADSYKSCVVVVMNDISEAKAVVKDLYFRKIIG
jgi:hypothetical protein